MKYFIMTCDMGGIPRPKMVAGVLDLFESKEAADVAIVRMKVRGIINEKAGDRAKSFPWPYKVATL